MRSPRLRWIGVGLTSAVCLSLGGAQAIHAVDDGHFGAIAPICRVDTTEKVVALTFDDGPDPTYTPSLLRLLGRAKAKATFFLIGEHAQTYPALVRGEVAAGMQIGDHTWSHPYLTDLSTASATSEIVRGRSAIEASASGPIRLFRAPYGLITPEELKTLASLGLAPVHWTLALDRWASEADPTAAARSIASAIQPGYIVLAHDARDGGIDRASAMKIVSALVPLLQARGYRLVTVSDLLALGDPVRAVPRPWFWQSGFSCPSG